MIHRFNVKNLARNITDRNFTWHMYPLSWSTACGPLGLVVGALVVVAKEVCLAIRRPSSLAERSP